MTSMAAKRRAKRARRISLAGGQTAAAKPMGRDRWHTQAPDGPPPILAAHWWSGAGWACLGTFLMREGWQSRTAVI